MSRLSTQSVVSRAGLVCALFGLLLSGWAWVFFHDDWSAPGTAVLGAYRERWFLLCMAMTYCSLWATAVSFWRFNRTTLLRIGLMHLALLLPLLVAECTAFAGLVDFESLAAGHRATRNTSAVDPRLRWVGLPHFRSQGTVLPDLVGILGADAVPLRYSFQADEHGLRNPAPKPEARVLCLGDSILVGGLVPVDHLVTEKLERRLGVSVMNVSEVAYSPQEELIRLETLGLDLRRRLIVQFVFEGNDLQDSEIWRSWRTPQVGRRWPASGATKALLGLLHGPKRAAGARRVGAFAAATGQSVPVYFLYDASRIDRYLAELDHLRTAFCSARDRFAKQGAAYAIVLVPAKLTVLHACCTWSTTSEFRSPRSAESGFRRRLAQICKEDSIPFQDLTPALRATAAKGELPYFAADTHLNATGHAAAAEALSTWIADLIPQR